MLQCPVKRTAHEELVAFGETCACDGLSVRRRATVADHAQLSDHVECEACHQEAKDAGAQARRVRDRTHPLSRLCPLPVRARAQARANHSDLRVQKAPGDHSSADSRSMGRSETESLMPFKANLSIQRNTKMATLEHISLARPATPRTLLPLDRRRPSFAALAPVPISIFCGCCRTARVPGAIVVGKVSPKETNAERQPASMAPAPLPALFA